MSSSKYDILHLVPDEKITNDIIRGFDVVKLPSLFVIHSSKGLFKHILSQKNNVIKVRSIELEKWIDFYSIKAIIVHGLQYEFAQEIYKLKCKIKIAWVEWGFDVYSLPKIRPNIYATNTKRYLIKRDVRFGIQLYIKRNDWLRRLYFNLIKRKEDSYGITLSSHSKISYFCTYIKEDFDYFSAYYPNSLKFVHLAFCNINQYLAGEETRRVNNDAVNILVGNSNSSENNHIDALNIIAAENDLNRHSIIVPLSYGDDPRYKEFVCERGKQLFIDRLVVLDNFLLRSEYLNILQTCSTGVFYHFRQQAMGNIIAMLYMGCRIYLSQKNPAFLFFKRIGIIVFDLDVDFAIYRNSVLPRHQAETNREVLETVFSEMEVTKNINDLINMLLDVDK